MSSIVRVYMIPREEKISQSYPCFVVLCLKHVVQRKRFILSIIHLCSVTYPEAQCNIRPSPLYFLPLTAGRKQGQ